MGDLRIATSERDARAVKVIAAHHAALAGAVDEVAGALLDAVASRDEAAARAARNELVLRCRDQVLPTLAAEHSLLRAAAARVEAARPLLDALRLDLPPLEVLVARVASGTHPVRIAADARAVAVLVEGHLARTDAHLLPLLASAPGLSLAGLAEEILGSGTPPSATQGRP